MRAKQSVWPSAFKVLSISTLLLLTGCPVFTVSQLPKADDERIVGVWKQVWPEDDILNPLIVEHIGSEYRFATNASDFSHGTTYPLTVAHIRNSLFVQVSTDTCKDFKALRLNAHSCYDIFRVEFSGREALVYGLNAQRLLLSGKNGELGTLYDFIPHGSDNHGPEMLIKGSTSDLASFLELSLNDPQNFGLIVRYQKID